MNVMHSYECRLCKPKSSRMHGTPFRPIKAVAVDLFPHSPHTELVMLFERDDERFGKQ